MRQSARLCVAPCCRLSPGPANRHAPEQSQNHPLRPDRQSRCDQAIMRSSAGQSRPGGGATAKSHLTEIEQRKDWATVTKISRGGACRALVRRLGFLLPLIDRALWTSVLRLATAYPITSRHAEVVGSSSRSCSQRRASGPPARASSLLAAPHRASASARTISR